MHCFWMKEPRYVARRAERTCRGPFELQQQNAFVAHPASAADDRFDARVDRLDDSEAHRVVAVGRDPFDMTEEEVTQALHLGQSLPPQRPDPTKQEVEHAGSRLVGPQAIRHDLTWPSRSLQVHRACCWPKVREAQKHTGNSALALWWVVDCLIFATA